MGRGGSVGKTTPKYIQAGACMGYFYASKFLKLVFCQIHENTCSVRASITISTLLMSFRELFLDPHPTFA